MARVRILVSLILALMVVPVTAQNIRLADGTIAAKVVVYSSAGTESTSAAGGASEATLSSIDANIDTLVTNASVDATHDGVAKTTGPQGMCFASAAAPTAVSADGDAVREWCSLTGARHFAAEGVEDVAETAAGFLMMVGTVRRDVAAASAGTTGDNATINTDALGLLWTRALDPCSGVAKTFIPFLISTATTTEITPSLAGASTNYYVCSIDVGPVAGAQTLTIADDDTDGCASVTAGMNTTGTTAANGWSFPANGGIALGTGSSSIMKTNGTNRVICFVTGQAVVTPGVISVVAAP